MQAPSDEKLLGVVYNTSMNRPDAALALAALYSFEGRRESRIGSVCVSGAGLNTAIFCDIVGRVYMLGAPRNSNSVLPVGLANIDPMPPDAAMVLPAIERRNEANEPQYARSVRRMSDTSVAEAVLRNGIIFNAEAAVILSAPATSLARSLDLPGAIEIYRERVRRLVIVDSGVPQKDVAALRRILAEWPTPIFLSCRDVGEALPFPAAHIESDFNWAPAHPVVDAYRAYKAMPYDAPSHDLAAAHFAIHPGSGFFRQSEPGSVLVSDDGYIRFASDSGGKVRRVTVERAQKEAILQALVEVTCAKPVPPPVRIRRRPDAAAVPPLKGIEPPEAPAKPPEKKPQ